MSGENSSWLSLMSYLLAVLSVRPFHMPSGLWLVAILVEASNLLMYEYPDWLPFPHRYWCGPRLLCCTSIYPRTFSDSPKRADGCVERGHDHRWTSHRLRDRLVSFWYSCICLRQVAHCLCRCGFRACARRLEMDGRTWCRTLWYPMYTTHIPPRIT